MFVYLCVHIYIHMYVGTFVLSSDFVYLCTLFYFILFRHFCADHHNLLVMVFSGLSVRPSIRSSVVCLWSGLWSFYVWLRNVFFWYDLCRSVDFFVFILPSCCIVWLWTCCDHSVSLLVFFLLVFLTLPGFNLCLYLAERTATNIEYRCIFHYLVFVLGKIQFLYSSKKHNYIYYNTIFMKYKSKFSYMY